MTRRKHKKSVIMAGVRTLGQFNDNVVTVDNNCSFNNSLNLN